MPSFVRLADVDRCRWGIQWALYDSVCMEEKERVDYYEWKTIPLVGDLAAFVVSHQ